MALHSWSWNISSSITHQKVNPVLVLQRKKPAFPSFSCIVQSKFAVGIEDVIQIVNNKVVIAAGVSSAIGQLAKPFTSSFLYGKRFDFGAAFQAGGFPSTHSSVVVATAASLGFERGFSDSVFGMSLVYAALVMYDAQGVRKEVGEHAKVMNKVLLELLTKSSDPDTTCQAQTPTPPTPKPNPNPYVDPNGHAITGTKESCSLLLLESDNNKDIPYHRHYSESISITPSPPLKESVGHTAAEVVAGALLGLVVSLALHTL